MTYTFHISLNDTDTWVQFYPLYGDLDIDNKKEDKDVYFRRILEGGLVFKGDEYTTIYGYENDDEIKIEIRQDGVADWWIGYFGKFDGDWDKDACTFTVTPTVDDEYTCLKQKGDEKWNILNVGTAVDVDINFSYYEYIECNDPDRRIYYPMASPTFGVDYTVTPDYTFYDTVNPENKLYGSMMSDDVPAAAVAANYNRNINACGCLPDQGENTTERSSAFTSDDKGFIVYETSINSVYDDHSHATYEEFDITTTWFREVLWTIDLDNTATVPDTSLYGTGWSSTGSDHVGAQIIDGIKLHKWARRPIDNPTLGIITEAWIVTHNGDNTFPKTWTFDTSLLPDLSEEIEQCRPITDVVDYMLNQMSCSLTYESTFFDNDALPTGAPTDIDTLITANPTYSYVTEAVNKLNYLMIAQKSDVIACLAAPGAGCASSEAATKGMLSFNELAKILYNMFQVYPFIDPDGNFRFEHERYFNKELGDVDLTTEKNSFINETWDLRTNKYKYVVQDLYGKERWRFMEQNYPDFIGETIDYDSILSNTRIKQEEKEYSVDMVTTDIMMIYQVEKPTPSLEGPISTDGFVILQCSESGGVYTCDNEEGALSGASMPNNHLSVANLQDKYWRWNRIQEEGTMNKVAVEFNSTSTPEVSFQRIIEQVPLIFNNTDHDPLKLIKTSLGNGEVKTDSYNLSSGITTVTLRYIP